MSSPYLIYLVANIDTGMLMVNKISPDGLAALPRAEAGLAGSRQTTTAMATGADTDRK